MNTQRIPGILTPLIVAAAIIVSFRYQRSPQTIELQGSEEPPPAIGAMQYAFEQAFAPGSPGYEWGSKDAPVTVLELSDFGCPYCGKFARETYPQLEREFVDSGLVRWKYVPFVLGMFRNGADAARAAECAAEQGLPGFRKMHDKLFAAQDEWKHSDDVAKLFAAYARAARLDGMAFAACYESNAAEKRIFASNRLAEDMGVRVTPTFFVNGARLEGALPIEQFRALLRDAARSGGVN